MRPYTTEEPRLFLSKLFYATWNPTSTFQSYRDLFAMANDQNLISLFPSIPAFSQDSASDPDVLFDVDDMADLYGDTFRRDSHQDSTSGTVGKNGKATEHRVLDRTKLILTGFDVASLHASKNAPHTSSLNPSSSEVDQPIPSSPLMPDTMWTQNWNQDFALFDQGNEVDLTQQVLPFPNSHVAHGLDTFVWPEPDILPAVSIGEHSSEPSQDGLSPLSNAHASGVIIDRGNGDTSHIGVAIDKVGSWVSKTSDQSRSEPRRASNSTTTVCPNTSGLHEGEPPNKRSRTDSTASTKEAAEKDSAGGVELRRRAKNRIAANKSRAKSKRHHEILQERYEQSLDQNSALKRQEQALRETAAFLKDCLLQHNSSSCSCKCLHQFNKLRAENIARGIISPGGRSTA